MLTKEQKNRLRDSLGRDGLDVLTEVFSAGRKDAMLRILRSLEDKDFHAASAAAGEHKVHETLLHVINNLS